MLSHLVKDWATALGALAGFFSFLHILVSDFRAWRTQPRLSIEFNLPEDLREWGVHGAARMQKVGTVHVRNRRRTPALECAAVLQTVSVPLGVTLGEKEYSQHWADVDYTMHSNVAIHVDIGLERRRLDVVFTVALDGRPPTPGALVAIPIALSAPQNTLQAFLPPGEYRFRLIVACANGPRASKDFIVNSPANWQGLTMRSA